MDEDLHLLAENLLGTHLEWSTGGHEGHYPFHGIGGLGAILPLLCGFDRHESPLRIAVGSDGRGCSDQVFAELALDELTVGVAGQRLVAEPDVLGHLEPCDEGAGVSLQVGSRQLGVG